MAGFETKRSKIKGPGIRVHFHDASQPWMNGAACPIDSSIPIAVERY
jgi:hypothetical protein